MALEELPQGWTYPICHATLRPRVYWGVPEGLCVLNGLTFATVTVMFWGPACVVGVVLHKAMQGLTALDPYWLPIIRRYIHYTLYYRG